MSVVQNERPKRAKISKEIIDKRFKCDFNVLYDTKRGSDVILVAGDKQFKAHKAILMARSDVFAAMFDNQMRESIENKVEIKDIEPEVLDVMLLFIYTGDVKDMDKIGAQLMTAADKYGLDQLKTICSRHLITNICVNTAIETLILSKLMDDSNLKRSALEFIRDNIRDVIKTKDWINLTTKNSELLNEIILFSTNNHSIETKIRFNSKQPFMEKSAITDIHGLTWGINAIFPEVGIKYLRVFLCCYQKVSRNFKCNVRGRLGIVSQNESNRSIIIGEINKTYCQDKMDCDFTIFSYLDVSKYDFSSCSNVIHGKQQLNRAIIGFSDKLNKSMRYQSVLIKVCACQSQINVY